MNVAIFYINQLDAKRNLATYGDVFALYESARMRRDRDKESLTIKDQEIQRYCDILLM